MDPYEARVGTAVLVREGTRRREFVGMRGVIESSFGDLARPALDVRLENGRRELFRSHQLDEAGED